MNKIKEIFKISFYVVLALLIYVGFSLVAGFVGYELNCDSEPEKVTIKTPTERVRDKDTVFYKDSMYILSTKIDTAYSFDRYMELKYGIKPHKKK